METTIMVVLLSLVGLVLSGAVLIGSMTKAIVSLKKDVSFNKLVLNKWATYNEELRISKRDLEYDLKVRDLEVATLKQELDMYKSKYNELSNLTPEDIFGYAEVKAGKVISIADKREIGFTAGAYEVTRTESKTLAQLLNI
jgi:hypothetical protein